MADSEYMVNKPGSTAGSRTHLVEGKTDFTTLFSVLHTYTRVASTSLAKGSFRLLILLPLFPKYWDCMCISPCTVYMGTEFRGLWVRGKYCNKSWVTSLAEIKYLGAGRSRIKNTYSSFRRHRCSFQNPNGCLQPPVIPTPETWRPPLASSDLWLMHTHDTHTYSGTHIKVFYIRIFSGHFVNTKMAKFVSCNLDTNEVL